MENYKPAKKFDKKFGTSISQEYEFPFRLTADEVWDLVHENGYGDNCSEKLKIVLMSFEFPYLDMKRLTDWQRRDVLMGMASCINSDDIIWYIQGNVGCSPKSRVVEKEMQELLGKTTVFFEVQWVVSQKTWERMKEELFVDN